MLIALSAAIALSLGSTGPSASESLAAAANLGAERTALSLEVGSSWGRDGTEVLPQLRLSHGLYRWLEVGVRTGATDSLGSAVGSKARVQIPLLFEMRLEMPQPEGSPWSLGVVASAGARSFGPNADSTEPEGGLAVIAGRRLTERFTGFARLGFDVIRVGQESYVVGFNQDGFERASGGPLLRSSAALALGVEAALGDFRPFVSVESGLRLDPYQAVEVRNCVMGGVTYLF